MSGQWPRRFIWKWRTVPAFINKIYRIRLSSQALWFFIGMFIAEKLWLQLPISTISALNFFHHSLVNNSLWVCGIWTLKSLLQPNVLINIFKAVVQCKVTISQLKKTAGLEMEVFLWWAGRGTPCNMWNYKWLIKSVMGALVVPRRGSHTWSSGVFFFNQKSSLLNWHLFYNSLPLKHTHTLISNSMPLPVASPLWNVFHFYFPLWTAL